MTELAKDRKPVIFHFSHITITNTLKVVCISIQDSKSQSSTSTYYVNTAAVISGVRMMTVSILDKKHKWPSRRWNTFMLATFCHYILLIDK